MFNISFFFTYREEIRKKADAEHSVRDECLFMLHLV